MKTVLLPSARCLLSLGFALLLNPSARADGSFALSFDGVDDYVSVPHQALFNSHVLTVTAWVKTTQATGEVGLINKYVAASLNGWQVFLYNGSVRAWFFADNANYVWDGDRGLNGGAVTNGLWHHVAFTVDNSGGKLYVDGVLKDSRPWTGAANDATTTQQLRLGSYPGSGFYRGVLDEITIWNPAQSASWIQTNFNRSLIGFESGLFAYYRCNEGAGVTNADSSHVSGLNAGTLVNGTAWVPGVVLIPAVLTQPASEVTGQSAKLNGTASGGGTNTAAWFEWGATTNYGNVTGPQPLGAVGSATNFSQLVSGLAGRTPYYFRAVASNALGVAYGSNLLVTPTGMQLARRDHTATLLSNGKVLVAGGYVPSSGLPVNAAELYDPNTGLWSPTGPMAIGRGGHTATFLQNGKVLVAQGFSSEVYDPVAGTWSPTNSTGGIFLNLHTATLLFNGKVLAAGGVGVNSALYHPDTATWTSAGPVFSSEGHTATLLPNGCVLVAGGLDASFNAKSNAVVYDPLAGVWTNTGSLHFVRYHHTATMLPNGKVVVIGGSDNLSYLTSAELYDSSTGAWTNNGAINVPRGYATATLLPNGKVLVAAGYPDSAGTADIFDSATGTSVTVPLAASRSHHTATMLAGGAVLIAGGETYNTAAPIAGVETCGMSNATWTAAGSMQIPHYLHAATPLPNGKVLITGGIGTSGGATNRADLYDPVSGTWTAANPLAAARHSHTATLLPNGLVLVTGGQGSNGASLASAELYDPIGGGWTNTGSLTTNRAQHTATLLSNGKVLVACGLAGVLNLSASAEIYDPATGLWSATGSLHAGRELHTATLLPGGKVLVAGGFGTVLQAIAGVETYDSAAGIWTTNNPLSIPRYQHAATLLPNGRLLVTGGALDSRTELYDPATDTWAFTGSMTTNHIGHTATLLPNGKVLVAAGSADNSTHALSRAELYDPAAGSWTATASLTTNRHLHTATLLPNGRVLAAGGEVAAGVPVASAELYDVGLGFSNSWRPRIAAAASSLALGASLLITGSQFRGLSEGSGGNSGQDSASDYPLVQLRSLQSEQTLFLLATNWQTNSVSSAPVSGLPPGFTLATIFVNGIPGTSSVINVSIPVPTPPVLANPKKLPDGSLQFTFTNNQGALFAALASTNPALPASNWTVLAGVPEISPGHFQFADPQAANNPRRFYRVRSP